MEPNHHRFRCAGEGAKKPSLEFPRINGPRVPISDPFLVRCVIPLRSTCHLSALVDTPSLDASLGRMVQVRGIPHLAQSARSDPDFLYATPPMLANAAFLKESRMKFVERTKPNRKSGGMGHPWSVGTGNSSGEVFSHLLRDCPFFVTLPRTSYGATFSRPGKCRDASQPAVTGTILTAYF
jgi:hypothetical protein